MNFMRLDEQDFIDFIHDLRESYSRVLEEWKPFLNRLPRKALIEKAICQPAKRFYVSPTEASRIINSIENRGITGKKNKLVSQKYEDIYRIYLKKRAEDKFIPKMAAINYAINQPSSRFYIDVETAYLLLNKHIHIK